MKASGIVVWLAAVVVGFFISGAFSNFVLVPLAPPDAGVGLAMLFGALRLLIWLAFVWLVARGYQAIIRKP